MTSNVISCSINFFKAVPSFNIFCKKNFTLYNSLFLITVSGEINDIHA